MMHFFRQYLLLILPFFLFVTKLNAQQLHKLKNHELITRQLITEEHADQLATVQIQDFQGRIKPVHTLALDLLRKIYGKSSFKYIDSVEKKQRLTATQVFIGMQFKPDSWQLIPCIKIDNAVTDTIQKILPVEKNGYAKPAQFFDFQGNYKLKKIVAEAYATAEGKRNTLEKSIIKIDERLNIVWAIFNGQFLKIFPNPTDASKKWFTPKENLKLEGEDQLVYNKLIPTYFAQLEEGIKINNWEKANENIEILKQFQQKNAYNLLLSKSKVAWEIRYNKQQIFFVSMILYTVIGIWLLVVGFYEIFLNKKGVKTIGKIGMLLLVLVFLYHGFGIGLRWYISGHAPWSNGYEATIFISWVSVFAGIIFSKKTKLPAASTALVALCLMGIAHGNLMNPEITNLVPVLKSYWLMIHVAIITGSYGFLTMGSLLALIVLICMSIMNQKKRDKILPKIHEITQINERTTTIGLFMLTIGTFLGGVWANESWGRYWGWDPKETWALISIIIYSFVLHIRIIFKNNNLYLYNVSSLFALGSLVMTFFGVNYYLSGLHSYAKGDPVPIPMWIYIVVPVLLIISIFSFFRLKKSKPK